VADLADGRAAREQHAAQLPGREAQDAVALVLRDELDAGAGAAGHLAAAARLELDVVDERPRRAVLERERVAGLDVGVRARLDARAGVGGGGGEDVRFRAGGVGGERDVRRAVGVVLDRRALGRHAVLRPLEVDPAVAALVAAPFVARRDAAFVVAPASLLGRA